MRRSHSVTGSVVVILATFAMPQASRALVLEEAGRVTIEGTVLGPDAAPVVGARVEPSRAPTGGAAPLTLALWGRNGESHAGLDTSAHRSLLRQ